MVFSVILNTYDSFTTLEKSYQYAFSIHNALLDEVPILNRNYLYQSCVRHLMVSSMVHPSNVGYEFFFSTCRDMVSSIIHPFDQNDIIASFN